jgi:hypothetical protein
MLSASLREIMLLGYNPQEMILPPALSPYAYRMSLTAVLILRFHDIKTLAPRGVNNS